MQDISFAPDWNALVMDDYVMTISVIHPADENPTNDILTINFTLDIYHDVGMIDSTTFIEGGIYPTGIYTINGTIENYGTEVEAPIFVVCEIFNSTNVSIFTRI